ncbi:MAG TPA: hypothetical protein VGP25_12925, partial [Gemmatimonadaceae bacterium]|nr:hypothetical protein [Gemmatimonadaceae bacterium]
RSARIEVSTESDSSETIATPADAATDDSPPLVVFAGVRAHERASETLALRGASAARGHIALGELRARITVPHETFGDGAAPRLASDVYAMLTLCAAFLVGRLGGALVHAGAVVDPDGRAWLLAGDTHAGKTTTCVSLVDAGWSFLADDQVVLRRDGDGEIVAEGWPRHAHLDEGWSESVVTGARAPIDLRTRWGDRWRERAPLGGLLFPAVAADAPTSAATMHAATAFVGLVRQSPWLMADRGAAPDAVALLGDACRHPAFALTLGRDGYARGDVIAERLSSARSAGRGGALA